MKENTLIPGKSLLTKLFPALGLFTILFISACGGNGAGGENKAIELNCVKITHEQLERWVKQGWTNPDSPSHVTQILLQPFYDGTTSEMPALKLVAYPGTSPDQVKVDGQAFLTEDTTCKSEPLSGETILSDNVISFQKLGILNEDGSLKNFDYIRFTPERYPKDGKYINYKVEIVTDGKPQAVEGGGTWPCPPYCNDPEN